MEKERQPVHMLFEKPLLKRLDDFRFKNRFESRSDAIKWLLDWALSQKPARPETGLTMLDQMICWRIEEWGLTDQPEIIQAAVRKVLGELDGEALMYLERSAARSASRAALWPWSCVGLLPYASRANRIQGTGPAPIANNPSFACYQFG